MISIYIESSWEDQRLNRSSLRNANDPESIVHRSTCGDRPIGGVGWGVVAPPLAAFRP
jgi:hypothetical protein